MCNPTHSFLAGRGLKLHNIPETKWAPSAQYMAPILVAAYLYASAWWDDEV